MICLVSGGFDPLHKGHVRLIHAASEHGRVVVALNSDAWLMRKKGYVFMPFEDRAEILYAIKEVHIVLPFEDADDTVCALLATLRPDRFANGGDRTTGNEKESALCKKLGILELFGVGGGKVESSSALVRRRLS